MISLVTTILNDKTGCAQFFLQMAAQTRRPDEIVIVDAGSADGTWELLKSHANDSRIKVRQENGCNIARGRNLAIAAASHEVIVSTDVGCVWEPQFLEDLVTPLLRDPACEAVMGSWEVRCEDLRSDWAKVEFAILNAPRMLATPRDHASSRAIAYRKSLWQRIGGYPEDLTLAADDTVYALLLHVATTKVVAAPVPRCHWERPVSLRSFCKEARRNFRGAGEAGIWLKHGVLVGGRLTLDAIAVPLGIILFAVDARVGAALLALGAGSVSLRVVRLLPAIRRARELGVRGPAWRVIAFEYLTKFWGIVGYWEGFLGGFVRAGDCRKRLRRAGSPRF